MTTHQPPADAGTHAFDDPEAAMRDARQRFIAAFPKRADSIGFLLNLVLTVGPKGPVGPLVEIVHRTAGLAGTLGFPSVSAHARTLEELLDSADRQVIDAGQANAVFDALRDGFSEDLATPPAWASTGPPATRPRRILVVEDDEDQREVVSIQLRAAGYDVVPVAAGDVAVDAARENRPDLILLDANLPGLDGFSVCRLLKSDPDLSSTPVIFTTVRAKVDDKAVGLLLGADEYLTKPLDLSELVIRISVLLDRQATRAVATPFVVKPDLPAELDYESFVVVAREQLAAAAAVLALVRVPEPMLMESFNALRGDLRRRDIVACFDPAHLVVLLENMPPAKAKERLTEIVTALGVGSPPRFRIGLAHNPGPGAKAFEGLLAEADQAIAAAFHRGVITAIAGEEPPAGEAQAAVKGKVVLADDDPEVVRLIDAQLRSAGYETIVAHDGGEAIAAVDAHRPDIVIVDIMMPKMTGVDVLSRLHHMPDGPRVIVLSARGREQDITRAFALGADDYVTKPFSPQELLARMERLLRAG